MEAPAIVTHDLVRRFDDLTAVDHVSLKIQKGELFGLLGPNGAGKTTIVKMLTTLIKPTAGSATVWGYDIVKDQDMIRANIGVVFQDPSVDNKLTGRENLDFHARMYGLDRATREQRVEDVLKLVELRDKADILLGKYSGGMQRRLEIARGLMHHPSVLFLDEPTLGLDAQTRRHIWRYIKEMNESDHVTIILTTHYLEEADFLCDRVAIIDHGRIIVCDYPDALKGMLRSEELPDPSLEDVFLHFTGREIRDEEGNERQHAKKIRRHWKMKRR